MLKKLLWSNRNIFFKDEFEYHEICRFSSADFFYSDVKQLAKDHGVTIVYSSHFKRYHNFGENCFVIINAPNMKKPEIPKYDTPVLFNPKTLMI